MSNRVQARCLIAALVLTMGTILRCDTEPLGTPTIDSPRAVGQTFATPLPAPTPVPLPASEPQSPSKPIPAPTPAPGATSTPARLKPTPTFALEAIPTPTPRRVLPMLTLTPIPLLARDSGYIAVSSGLFHTCALRWDRTAMCWGAGGAETAAEDSVYDVGQASPPDGERFMSISSGAFHTCGLRDDGTAVCWGPKAGDEIPEHGRVGFGQVDVPKDETFVMISSGAGHTCGLRADGTVACWGLNDEGQATPPDDERLTSIASGGLVTCGLRLEGTAVCWGLQPYSRGWEGVEGPPKEVVFRSIEAARSTDPRESLVCGVTTSGSPSCWGFVSDVIDGRYPWSLGQVTTITVEGLGGCGLWANGTPNCWGRFPHPWPKSQRFSAISAGMNHTCAIRKGDGRLVCWGDDEFGQASPPDGERFIGPEPDPEPVAIPEVPLVTMSLGDEHACGLDNEQNAWCWGSNAYGRSTPPAGEKFTAVSAGKEHTCALRIDGSITCWGKDDRGQASPPEGSGYVAISSGGWFSCAINSRALAVCWGSEFDGEEELTEKGRLRAISVGLIDVCGLRENGVPVCWSYGDLDFVGKPPEDTNLQPVQSVQRIDAGDGAVMAHVLVFGSCQHTAETIPPFLR